MGTRNTPFLPKHLGQDHPHAYGDKYVYVYLIYMESGSSPRVWGQVNIASLTLHQVRIIPTRMGTSRVYTS